MAAALVLLLLTSTSALFPGDSSSFEAGVVPVVVTVALFAPADLVLRHLIAIHGGGVVAIINIGEAVAFPAGVTEWSFLVRSEPVANKPRFVGSAPTSLQNTYRHTVNRAAANVNLSGGNCGKPEPHWLTAMAVEATGVRRTGTVILFVPEPACLPVFRLPFTAKLYLCY